MQVENDQLTVAAERRREWPRETEVHIAERGYGPISRAFRLPLKASRDGIRAAYTGAYLARYFARGAFAIAAEIK